MDYAEILYQRNDKFWVSDSVLDENIGKTYYTTCFKPEADAIDARIESLHDLKESAKGVRRELTKKLFNNHLKFFHILFDTWLEDNNNRAEIDLFYDNLYAMFRQVAQLNGIDPSLWEK